MHARKVGSLLLVVVAASVCAAGAATATWLSSAAGSADVVAAVMAAPDAPTVTLSSGQASVSWNAVAWSAPVSYVVQRMDADGVLSDAGGTCGAPLASIGCTDTAVPFGSSRYVVTAVHGGWSSAASAPSNAVVRDPALASLTLDVAARFHSAVASNYSYITYCGGTGEPACATTPPVQVRWGQAAGGGSNSGFGFDAGASRVVAADEPFRIGDFSHINYPVYAGTNATAATLTVSASLKTADGQVLFDQSVPIPMTIDETPNAGLAANCPYPSATPCSDKVSVALGANLSWTATANGITYRFTILGFRESLTGLPVTSFISDEYRTNSAVLVATFGVDGS